MFACDLKLAEKSATLELEASSNSHPESYLFVHVCMCIFANANFLEYVFELIDAHLSSTTVCADDGYDRLYFFLIVSRHRFFFLSSS